MSWYCLILVLASLVHVRTVKLVKLRPIKSKGNINAANKEIPAIFGGGGQLHRNRKDLLIEKGSIGVGGNLISPFEQPVAMRSIPYSATFRQASQLPAEFKMLHTGVV